MTAKLAIRRVHTGDRVLDDAQRLATDAAKRLNSGVFSTGVLISEEPGAVKGSGLSFSSGVARSIAHKLGRKAIGFLEVYAVDVPTVVHVGLFPSAHPSGVTSATHVTVTASWSGTCYLFVF